MQERVDEVYEGRQVELELKIKRRDEECLAYIRAVHDAEARDAVCGYRATMIDPPCGRTGWETYDELAAHMRMHLLTQSADEKVVAKVLKDTQDIVTPKTTLEVRAKELGADRTKLLERLLGSLGKQLPPGTPAHRLPAEADEAPVPATGTAVVPETEATSEEEAE